MAGVFSTVLRGRPNPGRFGAKTTIIPTKGFEKNEDARQQQKNEKEARGFGKEINQMWVPLLRVMPPFGI